MILVVSLALAERQECCRLLNLYMNYRPGRADGGHRAPSSHGNPNRTRAHAPRCSHPHQLWRGSTVTCVCYPIKGRFLCHFHQSVSSVWFSRHIETTWTSWVSLTLHILTSAVKTNKCLQSNSADCSHFQPSAGI